jgi:hypothetical protein
VEGHDRSFKAAQGGPRHLRRLGGYGLDFHENGGRFEERA